MLYPLHTHTHRTELSASYHLLLSFCFSFSPRQQWINETNKKGNNLYCICAQSVPRSIRANVFHVYPCTLSNGTCVPFTATGTLLLLENKSKSKQLPLVKEGNTIRLSHPWKAFCLWMLIHWRMHFNHSGVQCHRNENGKQENKNNGALCIQAVGNIGSQFKKDLLYASNLQYRFLPPAHYILVLEQERTGQSVCWLVCAWYNQKTKVN